MNNKFTKWLAWKLPPATLLWAVVRAFAYFDSPTDKSYEDVYKMLKNKFNIVD